MIPQSEKLVVRWGGYFKAPWHPGFLFLCPPGEHILIAWVSLKSDNEKRNRKSPFRNEAIIILPRKRFDPAEPIKLPYQTQGTAVTGDTPRSFPLTEHLGQADSRAASGTTSASSNAAMLCPKAGTNQHSLLPGMDHNFC